MDLTMTAIMIILTAFFLLAGSVKVTGWQKKIFEIQLAYFTSYGLNRPVMMIVGLVELFGAITMWVANDILSLIGISSIALTSIGALFFHLRFDTWQEGRAAMITLILSSIVTAVKIQTIM